jgi:hypothetical protein
MKRSTTRTIAVALAATVVILTASPAPAGHRLIRRTDPWRDAFIDVLSTSKATVHRTDRRVWFRVRFTGPDWQLQVFVDSRGGPRADYRLWNIEDLGTSECGGRRVSGDDIELRCGQRMIGVGLHVVSWSIPRAQLRPEKRIRWRVHTHWQGHTNRDDDDSAPDAGWYP